jgi:pimeloyl-ACP methyl ester carboxylesterase
MRKMILLVVFIILWSVMPIYAQDEELPVPERVELEAADGLVLVGDYYAAADAEGELPTVLLLHMLSSNRAAWATLIPPLLENGYNVLAVDQRGHGETGGSRDWPTAVTDVEVWLNWLLEQPSVKDDSLAIIGGSMGAVTAMASCAAYESCATVIALSPVIHPVLDVEAIADGLRERSALVISSQNDRAAADALRALVASAKGEIAAQLFTGSTHGTDYLNRRNPTSRERVTGMILEWLDGHLGGTED